MNLVIVESPTKAKTISKFLGKDYEIKFSMGHVMDLPKSKLGVDIADDFTPQLEVVADKEKVISELRKLAKKANEVILATDPDREGEAISANIKDLLTESGKTKVPENKFKRVVFHEITEEAIQEAFTHSREVDGNLVNAQIARRVLDRLVGYQLSPLLWKKVRRGLSAGRVQSVALRLLIEREREIEKFAKEPFFSIHAALSPQGKKEKDAVLFDLVEIEGKKIELQSKFSLYDGDYTVSKTTITTEKQADDIVKEIESLSVHVSDVVEKETKRSPQPPFTTSTLQQDASRRFGYPGKRTMSLAQKLYEEGFITYHRTDSVTLSPVAVKAMQAYIQKEFGDRYLPQTPRSFTAKQKLAQEAHEAIRPTKFTDIQAMKVKIQAELGNDHWRLYDLIWKRAVASQMADAIIESTTVYADTKPSSVDSLQSKEEKNNPQANDQRLVTNDRSKYRFKANGSVLQFDGFLKINPQALQDTRLPKFSVGEELTRHAVTKEGHETPPPPRYNDASLIGALEEKGIGRPSTYASIISTIVDRAYIERVEKRFIPTAIGMAVNDFLVKNFETVDDIPFTAQMEDDLDEVAHGKKEWVKMMKEFYSPFAKKLKEVEGAERVKIAVEETDEVCPKCGEGKLVVRQGKFGKFLSCGRFPDCDFTKPLVKETDILCPKDGGKIIIKKTRKGRNFFGCSNYPNCTFAAWKLEDIKKVT